MSRNIAPFPQYRPGRIPYMSSPSMNPDIPWSELTRYAYTRRDWKLLTSLRYIKNPLTITSLINNSSKIYYLTKFIDDMVLKGWIQRRLGFRTKRYGGKKRFAKRTANLATKQDVKRMISSQEETKMIITPASTLSITLNNITPISTFLNPLGQGDTDNTRTGDKVRNLQFKCMLYFICPAGGQGNYRAFIIRCKQPRGVSPTLTDIMGSASPPVYYNYNYSNIDFNSRYEIMADRRLVTNSNFSTQQQNLLLDMSFSCEDSQTDYSLGNAGSIADVDKNSYHLFVLGDQSTVSTCIISSIWYYKNM